PDEGGPSMRDSDSVPRGASETRVPGSRGATVANDFAQPLSRRKHVGGEMLGGRYSIVRELGSGGVARLCVAANLAIGPKVARKVVKPELLESEMFRKRFQKEAEAIAAIAHQNVVRLSDLIVGDPTFLVMEYVEGPTVAKVLQREKRMMPLRAAELARRL